MSRDIEDHELTFWNGKKREQRNTIPVSTSHVVVDQAVGYVDGVVLSLTCSN
jgi:hypothetical protein